MKVWTLIENHSNCEDLCAEHGLSLYLETEHHKILFDAGQSTAFAHNAAKMGIDLRGVDLAVLSHGHYDHSGGMAHFLSCNASAPVYVTPAAFEPHYNAENRYIGVEPLSAENPRLIQSSDGQKIGRGLTLHTCNGRSPVYPVEPYGLSMIDGDRQVPDDFRHEQYLLIEEAGKRILVSGCSHKGILNLVSWFRPDVLIGGFHFMKVDPVGSGTEFLRHAASVLMSYPTVYYTGHCTGDQQFDVLKAWMGDRLIGIHSGSSFSICE